MIPLHFPSGELRLLCLGAHPDDVEIGCGGTLLTLAETRDVTATIVVATGTEERHAEALKAAQCMLPGSELQVQVLGLDDGYLPSRWEEVKRGLEEVARSTAPDIIFCPRLDDAHQDHRVIAEIAATVWRDSIIFRYEIPKWDGDFGKVTHYVTIAPEVARQKVELLNESYPSQSVRDWWDGETFLGLMRLRGVECRAHYGEGFVVDKTRIVLD